MAFIHEYVTDPIRTQAQTRTAKYAQRKLDPDTAATRT
jgi:hypothetical protein